MGCSLTRRSFLSAAAVFPLSGDVKFGEEMRSGDVTILLVDTADGGFAVGVRTSIQADYFFAEVFYRSSAVPNVRPSLLLHQESLGVVAVGEAYGLSNLSFDCPKEAVEFVRVSFLNIVGQSFEFGREDKPSKRASSCGALDLRREEKCGEDWAVRS